MSISRDPVFFRLMQTALQKANPSGLPSNQVLTQFAMPNEQIYTDESARITTTQVGYPYGWAEMVATSGVGTYSLTEPMCDAWLLRLNAQKASTDTVILQATVGTGSQFTLTQIDPAVATVYAENAFDWSPAYPLGQVGISPWGNPGTPMIEQQLWPLMALFDSTITSWPDSSATWLGPTSGSATSAPVGQWMLKKWVYFPTTDTYTVSFGGDDLASLYMDGSLVVGGATYKDPAIMEYPVTAGWHFITASCINQGSAPKHTGILLSIANSAGTVIENGSDSTAVGSTWQTSGYINPPWTAVSNEDSMRYAWYVIPASRITSDSISLVVSATGSPVIHGIWWYNVAPWKWDVGGRWNATAASSTPAQKDPSVTSEVVG